MTEPTPRTDNKAYTPFEDDANPQVVNADFARSLERSLALKGLQAEAMREAIRRAVEKFERYKQEGMYLLPLDEIRADLEQSLEREEGNMIQFKWKECYGCSSPTRCEAEKTCYIIAPRAAEAGSALGGANVESIPEYFAKPNIVEGLVAAHPVLLVRQMANEILRLRSSRPAIIEECARVCEKYTSGQSDVSKEFAMGIEHGAMKCAAAIRALAPREQNAATQAGQTGWKPDSIAPSHEGHAAGPAVAAPNGAMDGDIVEFLCGGGTFKGCWYGGEKPSDEKGNFWWRKYLRAALRAAPSLTQLEDAIVEAIRFIGVKSGIPATVYGEMCHEVRAKLREQEQEGKDG